MPNRPDDSYKYESEKLSPIVESASSFTATIARSITTEIVETVYSIVKNKNKEELIKILGEDLFSELGGYFQEVAIKKLKKKKALKLGEIEIATTTCGAMISELKRTINIGEENNKWEIRTMGKPIERNAKALNHSKELLQKLQKRIEVLEGRDPTSNIGFS